MFQGVGRVGFSDDLDVPRSEGSASLIDVMHVVLVGVKEDSSPSTVARGEVRVVYGAKGRWQGE